MLPTTEQILSDESRKDTLLKIITEVPGIRYRELLRSTGFTNGVLTYHLGLLEKMNSVKVDRKNRVTRYYPANILAEESEIIGCLKPHTARQITIFILRKEICTFGEIVLYTRKAPSTVSWHLTRLKQAGIVCERNTGSLRYTVCNLELCSNILNKYKESFSDRVVNNYIDILEEL